MGDLIRFSIDLPLDERTSGCQSLRIETIDNLTIYTLTKNDQETTIYINGELDGYDIEGLFHINWGWGGLDNGYFRIDVMAPDDNSGIGASSTPDGYNMGQDAIIGLRLPDDVQAETQQPRLTVNDWEIRRGNTFFANYVNWAGFTATWDMGIGYVDETGTLVPV